jgi:solute carrier family 15 (oligopeptide transporter), member 1
MMFRRDILNPGSHWLDYAEEKHGVKMVSDTKALLSIILVYLPLPLFWALFDQQGSSWVEQASKLDGNFTAFTIQPEQMQVANPLLILAFIPLCEFAIYPFLRIFGIQRPLQKMSLGGVLAGVSFLCSMVLEMQINAAKPDKINMLWQLPQIIVMTLAEVISLEVHLRAS